MDTIYITGHRNPDTDSIVSAMAYAALKNALGQRQYEAARLGQISDETQTVLDRFGFQPPKLLTQRAHPGPGPGLRHAPHPVRRRHHQPCLADHAEGEDLRPPRVQ